MNRLKFLAALGVILVAPKVLLDCVAEELTKVIASAKKGLTQWFKPAAFNVIDAKIEVWKDGKWVPLDTPTDYTLHSDFTQKLFNKHH